MKYKMSSKQIWSSHPFSELNLHQRSEFFPICSSPYSDELLSSWMVRIALANLTSLSSLIFYETGVRINRFFDYKCEEPFSKQPERPEAALTLLKLFSAKIFLYALITKPAESIAI